jgi:DNA-directed RNA polymerase specialized sigma24 family protein
VSSTDIQSDSFEDLAMPLFDKLYNFAHWLTRNRDEAEDLVQETYVKALRGFTWRAFDLCSTKARTFCVHFPRGGAAGQVG